MSNNLDIVNIFKKIEKVCSISLPIFPVVSFGMNNEKNIIKNENNNNNLNNNNNNIIKNDNNNNIIKNDNNNNIINDNNDKNNNKINDENLLIPQSMEDIPVDHVLIFNELAKYNLEYEKKLGSGTFGNVYLFQHKKKNYIKYVLKITEFNKYNMNELKILKKHLPKIIGSEAGHSFEIGDKKYLYFVLEYCGIGTISDLLFRKLRKKVEEFTICYVAGQIVDALHILHSRGISHFDIKTSNILVDSNYAIRLSDFSTTYKYSGNKRSRFKQMGTECYMAPEVAAGSLIKSSTNFIKSDVFSLGVLCYHLFTRSYPYKCDEKASKIFDCKNKEEDKNLLKKEELDMKLFEANKPSDIFKDFILKCLERDVDKRWTIYEIDKHPFMDNYRLLLEEKEKLYDRESVFILLFYASCYKFEKAKKSYKFNDQNILVKIDDKDNNSNNNIINSIKNSVNNNSDDNMSIDNDDDINVNSNIKNNISSKKKIFKVNYRENDNNDVSIINNDDNNNDNNNVKKRKENYFDQIFNDNSWKKK